MTTSPGSADNSALRITVTGTLPNDTLQKIGLAVRRAALQELAELDLGAGVQLSEPHEHAHGAPGPHAEARMTSQLPPIIGLVLNTLGLNS